MGYLWVRVILAPPPALQPLLPRVQKGESTQLFYFAGKKVDSEVSLSFPSLVSPEILSMCALHHPTTKAQGGLAPGLFPGSPRCLA